MNLGCRHCHFGEQTGLTTCKGNCGPAATKDDKVFLLSGTAVPKDFKKGGTWLVKGTLSADGKTIAVKEIAFVSLHAIGAEGRIHLFMLRTRREVVQLAPWPATAVPGHPPSPTAGANSPVSESVQDRINLRKTHSDPDWRRRFGLGAFTVARLRLAKMTLTGGVVGLIQSAHN